MGDKGDFIAVIEGSAFLSECIRRSMQPGLPLPVLTYSTAAELERQRASGALRLVVLSLMDASSEASASTLKVLSELVPGIPIIVLANKDDVDLARTVFSCGAKGYIPRATGFEIAIEAVRFVLAGGTYVPLDCLLAIRRPDASTSRFSSRFPAVTARELAVIRAIQQAKPNKIIARELNMCEGTVKVHVRNVMRKLKARNRTDIAVSANLLTTVRHDHPDNHSFAFAGS